MGAYFRLFPPSPGGHPDPDPHIPLDRGNCRPWSFLGIWFAVQLLSGLSGALAAGQPADVAFWAHVGGFAAGLVLVRRFLPPGCRYCFDPRQGRYDRDEPGGVAAPRTLPGRYRVWTSLTTRPTTWLAAGRPRQEEGRTVSGQTDDFDPVRLFFPIGARACDQSFPGQVYGEDPALRGRGGKGRPFFPGPGSGSGVHDQVGAIMDAGFHGPVVHAEGELPGRDEARVEGDAFQFHGLPVAGFRVDGGHGIDPASGSVVARISAGGRPIPVRNQTGSRPYWP